MTRDVLQSDEVHKIFQGLLICLISYSFAILAITEFIEAVLVPSSSRRFKFLNIVKTSSINEGFEIKVYKQTMHTIEYNYISVVLFAFD